MGAGTGTGGVETALPEFTAGGTATGGAEVGVGLDGGTTVVVGTGLCIAVLLFVMGAGGASAA